MQKKGQLIKDILYYQKNMWKWGVVFNADVGADFVVGYCYDPKSELWMTYENWERGGRSKLFFETEEEALENLLDLARYHYRTEF